MDQNVSSLEYGNKVPLIVQYFNEFELLFIVKTMIYKEQRNIGWNDPMPIG